MNAAAISLDSLNEARHGFLATPDLVDQFMKATGKSRDVVERAVERLKAMSDEELVVATRAIEPPVASSSGKQSSRLVLDGEADQLRAGLGIFVPCVLAFAAGYAVGTALYNMMA